ncbi:MAG: hypothetical protein WAL22_17030, partial [Solirubrobacteraceae bacterium]
MPRLTSPTKLCGLVAAVAALSAALVLSVVSPSPASASTRQISIFQDDSFLFNPAAGLAEVRALGATTVRLTVQWYSLAPSPGSTKAPKFNASDPNAYSAAKWAPYDAFVKTAAQMGIKVLFQAGGGAPRWAEGKNPPASYRKDTSFAWMPNATMYGQFVHALTQRYSGTFTPSGSKTALPAVHMWSFWNEPNFGQDLGPQAIKGSTQPIAPKLYRALLNAGWKAIHQTQPHSNNTILIGEIAAKGHPLHLPGQPGSLPGNTSQTQALGFVRALYCLGANYRPLTGSLAALYSCPTTAAASRRFRAQNPGLFNATGFADHAYDSTEAPDANPATIPADDATFPVLKRVAAALDKVTKAYGSSKRYPIYSDEFGVITNPPQTKGGYPSPATAAVELNQAEYLSYKNPRVASYSQYLLEDPTPNPNPGFATGLFTSKGQPKVTLNAYELPVWLPQPTVKAGSSTELWGGARAAVFSQSATTKAAPTVQIQMQKNGSGPWTTIQTITVSTTTGYFDTHPKLPYSGNLRLAYTYPQTQLLLPTNVAGSTIFGRTVKVTVSG